MIPRFLLALSLLGPAALAEEIINPGFESELTEWSVKADQGMSQAIAEAARSGSYGLRVTDTDPAQGSGLFSLPIPVNPNTKYQVNCWARGVDGAGAVGVYLRFQDEFGKGIGKPVYVAIPSESREWQPHSVTAVSPANAVSADIWIHSFAKDIPVIDLDDFELKAIP